jgi:hypothetical protein
MPLDGNGEKYAELLYQKQLETIQENQAEELERVLADFGGRGGDNLASGAYLSARARVIGKHVGLLAEARAQTLLQAYERAGQPLNHATIQEITTQVNLFRDAQRRHLQMAASSLVSQNFSGPQQGGMVNALAGQMETELDRRADGAIRDLVIKHHEILLDDTRAATKGYAAAMGKQWDVFISHASEDKESFVRPLATALIEAGLQVWFDEIALTVGDSLRSKIDEGLSRSRFGIVVLSPNFFVKSWPPQELDGLMSREVSGIKVILPVWLNIDRKGVEVHSPMMAGRLAARSSDGMEKVISDLRAAMGLTTAE